MNFLIRKCLIICILLFSAAGVCANKVENINNQEFKQLIQQGVAVIDVRTITEWKKTGIIEGSHLLMFYDDKGKYDLQAWLAEVAKVASKEDPVILICHSGSRSKQLAHYLIKEEGYKTVYNVKKGIISWLREKNPTVSF